MRKQDNYTFLTTAPIRRVIPAMAVPTIISMLVTSIYNVVDTYYVGLLNTQATAAVGVVFPVMAIIQSIGFYRVGLDFPDTAVHRAGLDAHHPALYRAIHGRDPVGRSADDGLDGHQ